MTRRSNEGTYLRLRERSLQARLGAAIALALLLIAASPDSTALAAGVPLPGPSVRSPASASFPPAASAQTSAPAPPPQGSTSPAADAPRHLIVKYRSTGPHALEECAERISRRGLDFAPYTASGSDALDALQTRVGRMQHRALFRRTTGPSFEAETRALRERLQRARQRRATRARPLRMPGQGAPGIPGRRASIAPPAAAQACSGAACDATLPELAHVYRVSIPVGEADAEEVARALRALPEVEYAHADFEIDPDQLAIPFDDPFLASAGSWDQPYADLWGLHRIGAAEGWATTLGEGVVVAVVDTGIDAAHPDIADNVWVNPGEDLDGDGRATPADRNGLDDDGNGFVDDLIGFDFGDSIDANEDGDYDDPGDVSDADPFDERGHGTHVAGTIAAVADNGLGIVGVAPGARVMAVKGFPASGSGLDSVLWRAVLYAAENGAHVINTSWSCSRPCPSNDLARDVLAHVDALGAVVVTSAGNASTDVALRGPENTDAVLTVGAIGFDDRVPPFSNRGYGIDLVAPGGGPNGTPGVRVSRRNILSLLSSAPLEGEEPFIVGGDYRRLAGTSMAAPHVAGAVALARALRPDLGPEALRAWMRAGTRDPGPGGHDWLYGAGALHLPTLFASDPPEFAVEIEAPRSGQAVDPADGEVRFAAAATGADVASIELALATGTSGRPFVPLADLEGFDPAPAPKEADVALGYAWDPRGAELGARVLRIRTRLRDGRVLDRHRVFGVERIHPPGYTRAERDIGAPVTDGRRIAWPMEGGPENDGAFGIAVAPVRAASASKEESIVDPEPIAVGGAPRDIALDRQLLAWRIVDAGTFSIGWCRLAPDRARASPHPKTKWNDRPSLSAQTPSAASACDPSMIERSGAIVSRPWVAGGWLVWQTDAGADRTIEGCRPSRRGGDCAAQSLVALVDGGPSWRLQSFDGRTLLLEAAGRLARCPVARNGPPCTPQEIVLPPGTPRPDAPIHDGDLILFGDTTIAPVPPPGCLPGEVLPECAPSFAVLTRLHACRLETHPQEPGPVCDAVAVTEPLRFETVEGRSVSGRRIAWATSEALESASIRFCEFDPRTRSCPVQRVTGVLASQSNPTLAGRTLAWQGARDAAPSIWSLRLPVLRGPRRAVRIAPGPFAIPLRAWTGDGGALRYAVRVLEADETFGLETGLAVHDRGRAGGSVLLTGRASNSAVGRALLEVRATDAWGLESRIAIDLEIPPRPGVVPGVRPRP